MQIVIDIPEVFYETLRKADAIISSQRSGKTLMSVIFDAVVNGTPLPDGHGRIGDLDAVMSDISASINEMTNISIAVDGEYLWVKLNDAIDNAPTIIGADNTESEEKI